MLPQTPSYWTEILSSSTVVARLVLGGVFVWAGIGKLHSWHSFAMNVASHHLLSERKSRMLARFLPPTECILGLLLVAGIFTRVAAVMALALLSTMTAAIGATLIRGQKVQCMCFGTPADVGWWTIYRNVSLLLLGSIIASVSRVPLSLDAGRDERAFAIKSAGELTGIAVAVVVIFAWYFIGEGVRKIQRLKQTRGNSSLKGD